MRTIDLNCDVGEGGESDRELIALVSSANIACGGHAGNEATMRSTVELARAQGVAIGAHPGFEDPAHFGRRELSLAPQEIEELVIRQVNSLRRFASVGHVKPHGALYNIASRDATVAGAIVAAVKRLDPALRLFALSGSELAKAGRAAGLNVVDEVFADRTYRADGSLTPRQEGDAVIHDARAAVAQAIGLVRDGWVQANDGRRIVLAAGTVCIHGDTAGAVEFAKRIRTAFADAGIGIAAAGR